MEFIILDNEFNVGYGTVSHFTFHMLSRRVRFIFAIPCFRLLIYIPFQTLPLSRSRSLEFSGFLNLTFPTASIVTTQATVYKCGCADVWISSKQILQRGTILTEKRSVRL